MASDDRERNFEKALARRLRVKAGGSCPDAETLAAYHERSLTSEEMNVWKQHISACANCQEVLAQLDATEEIAVTTPYEQAWTPVLQSTKLPRAASWRWLVPAGALAAGLLVWIAVHERKQAQEPQTAKIEVAENHQPTLSAPISANAPAGREKEEKTFSSPNSKATTANTDNLRAAAGVPRNLGAATRQKKTEVPSVGDLTKQDRKDADLNALGLTSSVSSEAAGGSGGVAGASKSKQADLKKQEQTMNYVASAPDLQSLSGVPGPALETKSAPGSKVPPAAPPSAAAETLELSAGTRDASSFRMAKSPYPRMVSAPGGKVIWGLGMAGLIEQSTDGGLTWTPQTSGTTADLFLGSAPSEQVCWVIGNGGTILRTADGGAHWISVTSPISEKLYLIRASDSLRATIWDMTRRHSFQTEDGGVTWTQITSQ